MLRLRNSLISKSTQKNKVNPLINIKIKFENKFYFTVRKTFT